MKFWWWLLGMVASEVLMTAIQWFMGDSLWSFRLRGLGLVVTGVTFLWWFYWFDRDERMDRKKGRKKKKEV